MIPHTYLIYINFFQKIECCASGELTLDMRRCCLECARTDQESCGNHFGARWECASGLSCFKKLGLYIYLLLESVKLL